MHLEAFRLPHEYAVIDPAIRQETLRLASADGFPLHGRLFLPPRGEPETAVLVMHPRGDFLRHYLAPRIAGAGYAFLGTGLGGPSLGLGVTYDWFYLDLSRGFDDVTAATGDEAVQVTFGVIF